MPIQPTPLSQAVIAAAPRLESLEAAFTGPTTPFSCAGRIPLDTVDGARVYFRANTDEKAAKWASIPLSDEDTAALLEVANDNEILPPGFVLSMDILTAGQVLQDLQRLLASGPLVARATRLVLCPEGSTAADTPHDAIGSITVCLPSKFRGGQLVARRGGHAVTYDWAEDKGASVEDEGVVDHGGAGSSKEMCWAFLSKDSQNEILAVQEGCRVSITYDVFPAPDGRSIFDPRGKFLVADLRAAVADPDFYPNGRILAFGMRNKYSYGRSQEHRADYIKSQLKGADAAWLAAIIESGLRWEFVAVYDFDMFFNEEEDTQEYEALEALSKKDRAAYEAELKANKDAFHKEHPRPEMKNLSESAYQEARDEYWKAYHEIVSPQEAATKAKYVPAYRPAYKQRRNITSDSYTLLKDSADGEGIVFTLAEEAVAKVEEQGGLDWVVDADVWSGVNSWSEYKATVGSSTGIVTDTLGSFNC